MDLPRRRAMTIANALSIFNKLREHAPKGWIFLNPTSLGDTMTVCALAKAFKEKHGGAITMVVPEKQVPLVQMYAHTIDRVIPVSFQQLEALCVQLAESQAFCPEQPFVVSPLWQGDGRWEDFFRLFRFKGRGGVGFCDLFRHIMRLDWNAPLDRPVIPETWVAEAQALADQSGMVPGNSVILFPDNNSCPIFPDRLWEQLADALIARGMKVFTNLAGNSRAPRAQAFAGTTGINVPLHLAIPLVERAGRFISGNNGLMCTLMIADAQARGTILLYNKPFALNGFDNTDPVPLQSFRYLGFNEKLIPEFLINPDEDFTPHIQNIIDSNVAAAFVW